MKWIKKKYHFQLSYVRNVQVFKNFMSGKNKVHAEIIWKSFAKFYVYVMTHALETIGMKD